MPNFADGADTVGQTFLHGMQTTESTEIASFQTTFPGWHSGRTTQVHYQVYLADNAVLTSQIFIDEAINQAIYDDHAA